MVETGGSLAFGTFHQAVAAAAGVADSARARVFGAGRLSAGRAAIAACGTDSFLTGRAGYERAFQADVLVADGAVHHAFGAGDVRTGTDFHFVANGLFPAVRADAASHRRTVLIARDGFAD